MTEQEKKKAQINQGLAAILALCIVPLVWAIVSLINKGQIKVGWTYLIAISIYFCAFITIRAFPFSSGRPDRLLLRLYLFLCLCFTFVAVISYEPSIPIIKDAVAVVGVVLMVMVGYRPSFLSKSNQPRQE